MNANDNILTSLAALEQNLQDIVAAKKQVSEVVQSSKDLADVIASYQSSFDGLASNIDQILNESKDLSLNVLSDISKLTVNLKDEISKLSEFDFDAKFQTLQQEAIQRIERDLSEKLTIIDTKARVLQEKSDQFQKQIGRFESIDLEDYFDRHQKAFNELFNYLNQSDKRLHNRFAVLEDMLVEVQQQNIELRKEIFTNRYIQILGVVVVVALMLVIRWFLR